MTLKAFLQLAVLSFLLAGCSGDDSRSSARSSTRVTDVTTYVAAVEWRAVIEEWYVDGTFDRAHPCAAIREAAKRLPTSTRDFLTISEDIWRLERHGCS